MTGPLFSKNPLKSFRKTSLITILTKKAVTVQNAKDVPKWILFKHPGTIDATIICPVQGTLRQEITSGDLILEKNVLYSPKQVNGRMY